MTLQFYRQQLAARWKLLRQRYSSSDNRSWRPSRRVLLPSVAVAAVGVGYGCWQGYRLRQQYRNSNQLDPPTGPQDGTVYTEKLLVERMVVAIKEEIAEKMRTDDSFIAVGIKKMMDLIEQNRASTEQMKDTIRGSIFNRKQQKEKGAFWNSKNRRRRPIIAAGVSDGADSSFSTATTAADAQLKAAMQAVTAHASSIRKRYDVTATTSAAATTYDHTALDHTIFNSSNSSRGGGSNSSSNSNSSSGSNNNNDYNYNYNSYKNKKRQLKLLVLGDSLVRGVGVEGAVSPVLPKLVAEILSSTLKADVEWYCAGYVGADVRMLRDAVLPEVKQRMLRGNNNSIDSSCSSCIKSNRSSSKSSSKSSSSTEAKRMLQQQQQQQCAGMVKGPVVINRRYFFPFFSGGDIDMNPFQRESNNNNNNNNNSSGDSDIDADTEDEATTIATSTVTASVIAVGGAATAVLAPPPRSIEASTGSTATKTATAATAAAATTAATTTAAAAITTETTAASADTELVVIIICGLNDWKHTLERFPTAFGPSSFRTELAQLVREVQLLSCELRCKSCRVYLPKMPLSCIEDDPNFILGVRPLWYFVDWLFYIWDLQKKAVAEDDETHMTTVIDSPDSSSEYATPGVGNISSDGVHPSIQGYKWWALHIAEEIFRTFITNPQNINNSSDGSGSAKTEKEKEGTLPEYR